MRAKAVSLVNSLGLSTHVAAATCAQLQSSTDSFEYMVRIPQE